MQATFFRILIALSLLLAVGLGLAQDEPQETQAEEPTLAQEPADEPTGDAADQQDAQPVVEQAPSLRQAYQREFAFLQGQKADLERRLAAFTDTAAREQSRLQADIEALERELIDLTAQADRLEDQVFEAERSVESAGENVNLLAATFQQAEVTVDGYQAPALEGGNVQGDPMLMNYAPMVDSPALNIGAVPYNDSFFDNVDYAGAIPSAAADWTAGWTVGLDRSTESKL